MTDDMTDEIEGSKSDGPPIATKPPEPKNPYGVNGEGVPLDKDGNPAPYGVKKDGTAAKKRGRAAGSSGTSKRTTTRKPKAPNYVDGIMGLAAIPISLLSGAGIVTDNESLLADSVAFSMHMPQLAQAISDLAADNPALQGVLERALQTGPYGALIAAAMPLVAQIALNHGILSPAIAAPMGARYTPKQLADAAKQDMYAMQQAAAAEQAAAEAAMTEANANGNGH